MHLRLWSEALDLHDGTLVAHEVLSEINGHLTTGLHSKILTKPKDTLLPLAVPKDEKSRTWKDSNFQSFNVWLAFMNFRVKFLSVQEVVLDLLSSVVLNFLFTFDLHFTDPPRTQRTMSSPSPQEVQEAINYFKTATGSEDSGEAFYYLHQANGNMNLAVSSWNEAHAGNNLHLHLHLHRPLPLSPPATLPSTFVFISLTNGNLLLPP